MGSPTPHSFRPCVSRTSDSVACAPVAAGIRFFDFMSSTSQSQPSAVLSPTASSRALPALTASRPMPVRRGIPELSDLVLACRHHLLLTVVLGLASMAGFAFAAWVMIHPTYHAEGLVRVREKQSVILSAQTSRSEDVAFFRTQAKLAQSPPVLSAALEDPRVRVLADSIPAGDQVKWLTGLLRVDTQAGSEVMNISIGHHSPRMSQALCNAVTDSYLHEIHQRLESDLALRMEQLRLAAERSESQLDASWDKLNQVAQEIGSDNAESLTIRDQMQVQTYRDYTRRLHAAELHGTQLKTQLSEHLLHHRQTLGDTAGEVESLVNRTPEIRSARNRLTQLNLEIAKIQRIAADQHAPRLDHLNDQRNILADELRLLVKETRDGIQRQLEEKAKEQHDSALAKLHQEIEVNQAEMKYLKNQLEQMGPDLAQQTPKTVVPVDMSRHDVGRQRRLADSLWQAVQELEIEAHSQPRVTLIKLAELPEHPNHSKQIKAAGLAGVSGGLFVVLCIGFLEWRDCRIRHPDDIASRSQFPVFGVTSFSAIATSQPSGIKDKILACLGIEKGRPSSGVREAAARLILRDHGHEHAPSMLVTSAASSEPRHLVSIEMAILLAGFQRRVLLIDCDQDHARLSQALGAADAVGVRQIPTGKIASDYAAIAQLLLPTSDPCIDFLPVGPAANQQQWVDPRSLRSSIELMRDVYDVIIVNGSSLMGSAESILLASEVDFHVFACFLNQSRFDQLMMCETLSINSAVTMGGSILQTGKRKCELRALPQESARPCQAQNADAAFENNQNHSDTTSDGHVVRESDLQRDIEQLQQELRKVREGQAAKSEDSLGREEQPRTLEK